MYQIKTFNTARDFVDYNEAFIYSNPMQNILLINAINEVANGNLVTRQAFNIINESGVNLLVFIVDGYCLIYCDDFDENVIETLASQLPFERLSTFHFAGQRQAIESVLTFKELEFSVEKHLIVYKCDQLNPDFKIASGEMRLAKSSETNYLADLSVNFTREYDGNEESFDFMKIAVTEEISDNSLYVWDDNKICSMAVEINRTDFPEIGKLYTIPDERGKGYSSSLVFKLTEKILTQNPFCTLYTHAENPLSNATVTKVGYKKTFEFIRAILKN